MGGEKLCSPSITWITRSEEKKSRSVRKGHGQVWNQVTQKINPFIYFQFFFFIYEKGRALFTFKPISQWFLTFGQQLYIYICIYFYININIYLYSSSLFLGKNSVSNDHQKYTLFSLQNKVCQQWPAKLFPLFPPKYEQMLIPYSKFVLCHVTFPWYHSTWQCIWMPFAVIRQ